MMRTEGRKQAAGTTACVHPFQTFFPRENVLRIKLSGSCTERSFRLHSKLILVQESKSLHPSAAFRSGAIPP